MRHFRVHKYETLNTQKTNIRKGMQILAVLSHEPKQPFPLHCDLKQEKEKWPLANQKERI